MKSAFVKNIFRTIANSFGRYMAIFAIVALGVGFFSGLGTAHQSMLKTADEYLREHNMYHFRALSTVGFDDEAVDDVQAQTGGTVAGSYSADLLAAEDGQETVFICHSITEGMNTPDVRYGRLPAAGDECFADDRVYGEEDLGKVITVAEETAGSFRYREYTIVGVGKSPLYLSLDRGTTKLGDGKVSAFLLMLPGGFALDAYNEMYLDLGLEGEVYSSQYADAEAEVKPRVEEAVEQAVEARAERLAAAYAAAGLPAGQAIAAQSYLFTRADNTAYGSFESDTSIVDSIAHVFPVFFLIVAALVCSTTMTRMLEEHRTQIGTLRALGYTKGAILFKYMFYSGSAAMLGCVVGYFLGSWLFPLAIWQAYNMLYGFADLYFTTSLPYALISVIGALLCSAGTTWVICRRQLLEMPAQLIRPRAPVAGKRIFLERIPVFWKRLKFLHKVTARNIFRYKKRLFMMLIGIGGCAALVLTGFGIRDSISNIVDYQFEDIMQYDVAVNYADTITSADEEALTQAGIESYTLLKQDSAELKTETATKSAYLIIAEKDLNGMVDLHTRSGEAIAYPGKGEVVLNTNLAKRCDVQVGDTVTVHYTDAVSADLQVTGLCENHVYNYIYISADTFNELLDGEYQPGTVFARCAEDTDPHQAAAELAQNANVSATIVTEDIRSTVADSMRSMDAVVSLIILSAGALALIVLFNLINISITERVREIATIKVLGFYPRETASYVFRENLVLAIMGTVVGLPFGVLLHRFVMSQIKIDMVSFNTVILPQSYGFTIIAVIGFALLAELLMYKKVVSVPMAESLKSIE